MKRRDFIKKSCVGCGLVLGSSALLSLLEGCVSVKVFNTSIQNHLIRIPLSSLSAEEKLKIIRTENLEYDILLVRESDQSFRALLMKCTHNENAVFTDAKGLVCSLHGSTFDLNGEVTNGPALKNLQRYTVSRDGQDLLIHLQ